MCDHLSHGVSGTWINVGWTNSKTHGILEKRRCELVRHNRGRHSFIIPPADNLVVDVRDVHDICHFVAAEFEVPPHNIRHDKRPCVADMEIVVDGGSAAVHAYFPIVNRLEFLN